MYSPETWRVIPEAVDYEVSDHGRVRSWKSGDPYVLTNLRFDKRGSLGVQLCVDGRKLRRYVSRLVAKAFIPNPDAKPEVAHDDGDFRNNHVSNLRWATHAENMADTVKHGTSVSGTRNPNSVLTPEQVSDIRSRYIPNQVTMRQLAAEYGVVHGAVQRIVNESGWKHLLAAAK